MREDPVGEVLLLLPLLGVGPELLLDEAPDRLAEPVVLLGEDEVLLGGGEVGLENVGSGHTAEAIDWKVGSATSYFASASAEPHDPDRRPVAPIAAGGACRADPAVAPRPHHGAVAARVRPAPEHTLDA